MSIPFMGGSDAGYMDLCNKVYEKELEGINRMKIEAEEFGRWFEKEFGSDDDDDEDDYYNTPKNNFITFPTDRESTITGCIQYMTPCLKYVSEQDIDSICNTLKTIKSTL